MEKGTNLQPWVARHDINDAFFMIDSYKVRMDPVLKYFVTHFIMTRTGGAVSPSMEMLYGCFSSIMNLRQACMKRGDDESTVQFISRAATDIAQRYVHAVDLKLREAQQM